MALPAAGPDRTSIVTGASSGIGAELARGLATRGYGVTLVARREDRLQVLADELRVAAHGIRAEVIAADLADESSREGLVKEVANRELTVDILVNNAGFSTTGPAYRADPSRELALVRTDVEAVVHLCTLFLPGMVDRGAGRGAERRLDGRIPAATRSGGVRRGEGVRAVVRAAPRVQSCEAPGVTLTTLCPGPVETEFAAAAGFDAADAGRARCRSSCGWRRRMSRRPRSTGSTRARPS